jgi:excisionase family DNA binding protein
MNAVSMQERYLTIEEVAARLRVSVMTVIRRIRTGELRARREGRLWRIAESDVEAYIKRTYEHGTPQEND